MLKAGKQDKATRSVKERMFDDIVDIYDFAGAQIKSAHVIRIVESIIKKHGIDFVERYWDNFIKRMEHGNYGRLYSNDGMTFMTYFHKFYIEKKTAVV